MNIDIKYTEIKSTINNKIQELVLTPQYFFNKFRKPTSYLDRLNNVFLGVREENIDGSKYVATIFLQNFFTKEWMREEILIDRRYNILDVRTTRG